MSVEDDFADPHEDDDKGGVATVEAPALSADEQFAAEYDVEDPGQEEAPVEAKAPEPVEPTEQVEPTVAKESGETVKDDQQAKPVETSSGLSDDLLGLAARHGFSKEDAEAFGSEPALRRAMGALDRQIADLGRRTLPQQRQPEPKQEPKVEPKIEPQASETKLRLDPERVDEDIVKWGSEVKSEIEVLRQQREQDRKDLETEREANKALRDFHQQSQQAAQQRHQAEVTTKMETFFGSLGEEYVSEFGKGDIRSFAQDSAESRKRLEVWHTMNALHAGDVQIGRQPSSLEELQTRALNSLYPDKLKIAARKEVEKKVQARKATSISKPTSKDGKPLSKTDAAVAWLERFQKDHGVAEGDDDLDV